MHHFTTLCLALEAARTKHEAAQHAWTQSTKSNGHHDDSTSPFGAPLRQLHAAEAQLRRLHALFIDRAMNPPRLVRVRLRE